MVYTHQNQKSGEDWLRCPPENLDTLGLHSCPVPGKNSSSATNTQRHHHHHQRPTSSLQSFLQLKYPLVSFHIKTFSKARSSSDIALFLNLTTNKSLQGHSLYNKMEFMSLLGFTLLSPITVFVCLSKWI